MIKKILIGIGVVLLLLIGAVAFLLWKLDPEELGQEVIRRVNAKGAMQLEAQTFSIKPFQGVFLEQAHVTGDGPSGRIEADVAKVIVEYELLPILKRKLVIDRIIIEQPRAVLVSRPPSETSSGSGGKGRASSAEQATEEESTEAEEGGGSGPAVAIDEVRIVNGSLAFRTEGQESDDLAIEGLELELDDFYVDPAASAPLVGLTARGRISFERLVTGDMSIDGGRGSMEMRSGVVAVRDLGIETANASLSVAALDLDLREGPPTFHLEAGGSFDLDSFVEAQGEGGFGPAALSLALDGAGPDTLATVGEGSLRMEPGTIPAFRTVTMIERILGEPLITGAPYRVTDIDFTLADGVLTVLPFRLELENLQIAGAGTSALGGDMDMRIDVRLPRERVDIDALDPVIDGMTDEEGWTVVPFKVKGTADDPDVSLDMSAAKDLAKNALDEVMDSALESAEKRLRKLLKRDRDDGR